MIVLRILVNALIMAGEIAAVAGVAVLGYHHPVLFAGLTAALTFGLGLRLEVARLRYELPFYFGALVTPGVLLTGLVGFSEAVLKAVLAGIAALFTFSGTDADRLYWVAIVFGICIYAGASLLRVLSIRANGLPMRWGYFRLAPLLGLTFSAGLALLAATHMLPPASVGDLGWKIIFEMPPQPSIAEASELLFQIKQAFDDFIVTVLGTMLDERVARLVAIVISVNVLSGFVSALYAALIASAVRRAEETLL
ncbi:MAG TPA: hypothetical protein VGA65_05545 [Hyphomicrobium sp.]